MCVLFQQGTNNNISAQNRGENLSVGKKRVEIGQTSSLVLLQVQKEAIQAVEQDGMVFIDEIDKIVVNHDSRYGACCDALDLTQVLFAHASALCSFTSNKVHATHCFRKSVQ